jgi:hypothetical protein
MHCYIYTVIHTRARHYCCSVIGQEKRRDHPYICVPSCNYGVLAIQRNKHIRRIACLACATYQDSLVHGRVLYTWWWATAVTRLYNIFMHACGSWLGINKPRGRWSCNSCSRIRLALYT